MIVLCLMPHFAGVLQCPVLLVESVKYCGLPPIIGGFLTNLPPDTEQLAPVHWALCTVHCALCTGHNDYCAQLTWTPQLMDHLV